MTTLVTGARGSVGSLVLAGLRAAGRPVRASSRSPRPDGVPEGVQVVTGDLGRPDTFAAMLDGVDQVFLYADDQAPEAFADAARGAGVQHVVLLSSHSVLLPGHEHNPTALLHQRVETALTASGLASTFVRPGYFATNTLRWASIRTDRVLRTAFPDGRSSPVHERDVAEVAVAALTDPALRGSALLVPGAGPVTLRDQVARLAAALGEPIRLEQVSEDEYRQQLAGQLPPHLVDRQIRQRGDVSEVEGARDLDAVPQVLHRPSLSWARWAQDHADDFR